MAEIAGLALGAVALVDLFNTCIELFNFVLVGKAFERDFRVLSDKLDVEKASLLRWAKEVRLFKKGRNGRFKDQSTTKLVQQVLCSISRLLGDGELLRQKYGFEQVQQHGPPEIACVSSRRRIQTPADDAEQLEVDKSRARHSRRRLPLKRKMRWIVHDRERFEKLIQDLSYFTSKLNEIVPITVATPFRQKLHRFISRLFQARGTGLESPATHRLRRWSIKRKHEEAYSADTVALTLRAKLSRQ